MDEQPPWKFRALRILAKKRMLYAGFAIAIALCAFYYWHDDVAAGAIAHVALPSMVLYMELYMLCVMTVESLERKGMVTEFRSLHAEESAARERVVDDLNRFRISVSRDHYRQELERTLEEAKDLVVFTGVSMEASNRERAQLRLIELIRAKEKAAKKAGKDFVQKGLIAERTEALAGALELSKKTSIQLRFRQLPVVTRLRFQVCDRLVSVIGVAEGKPTTSEVRPTQRSFTIESSMLGDALTERFEREFNDSTSKDVWQLFDEFLRNLLGDTPKEKTILTRKSVMEMLNATELGIDEAFLATHCERFRNLKPGARTATSEGAAPTKASSARSGPSTSGASDEPRTSSERIPKDEDRTSEGTKPPGPGGTEAQ